MVQRALVVDYDDVLELYSPEYNEGIIKFLRLWEFIRVSGSLGTKKEGLTRLITNHGTYKFYSTNQGGSTSYRIEFMDYTHSTYSITGKITPIIHLDEPMNHGLYFRYDKDDGFFDMSIKHDPEQNGLKFYDIYNQAGFSIPSNLSTEQYFQYSLLHDIPIDLSTIQEYSDCMYNTIDYCSNICVRRYIPRQVFRDMVEISEILLHDLYWDIVNDFK